MGRLPRCGVADDSLNHNLPGPPAPAWRRVIVIVEAAAADRVQVASLAALSWLQQAHAIDFRTVGVLGVGIRRHEVRRRVMVHEQHA